ncbi:hypothetical protein DPMN_135459 [Dreissena polymorpha]|uniref:Uncharacterized protein n=1 Tax=Dreissena polymorpha TaxID=45954 RepID=A0A9D4JBP8_DREPO|nr:hypothetical protein DPMN_135459 [Dreissena polymorpha]
MMVSRWYWTIPVKTKVYRQGILGNIWLKEEAINARLSISPILKKIRWKILISWAQIF